MKRFISYGKQSIDDEDIAAVVRVLKSDFLTQGPAIAEFERSICDYTGASYCVAVSNATAALHIAVKALDLEKGMEGITSPITFVASSNCLVYNDLKPVFADINESTINIDPDEIEKRLSAKTRVIIPVHFAGRTCDMEKISKIAHINNCFVIEDAAHAIGSEYPSGSKVGSCQYSDMTVFSFHPVKTITTGEGGAITTNNLELYNKLILLRSHGITRDAALLSQNPGMWYYEMQALGYNYRMTDFQAALGTSQMRKLDANKNKRNYIISRYNKLLSGNRFIRLPEEDRTNSCYHLYVVRIDFKNSVKSRQDLMQHLKNSGIGTQVHYIPVHLQPYYQKEFHYKSGDYPVSENYYEQALSLPLFPEISDDELELIASELKDFLS